MPPSVLGTDIVQTADQADAEPSVSGSIAAGEVPLSFLLSGSDVTGHADLDSVEQLTELVPLQESSLAMVATLWTAPSDARAPEANGRHAQPVRVWSAARVRTFRHPGQSLSSDSTKQSSRANARLKRACGRTTEGHTAARMSNSLRKKSWIGWARSYRPRFLDHLTEDRGDRERGVQTSNKSGRRVRSGPDACLTVDHIVWR